MIFIQEKVKFLHQQMQYLVENAQLSLPQAAAELLKQYIPPYHSSSLLNLTVIDRDSLKITPTEARIICEPVRIEMAAKLVENKKTSIENALRIISHSSLETVNALIQDENYLLINLPRNIRQKMYFADIDGYHTPALDLYFDYLKFSSTQALAVHDRYSLYLHDVYDRLACVHALAIKMTVQHQIDGISALHEIMNIVHGKPPQYKVKMRKATEFEEHNQWKKYTAHVIKNSNLNYVEEIREHSYTYLILSEIFSHTPYQNNFAELTLLDNIALSPLQPHIFTFWMGLIRAFQVDYQKPVRQLKDLAEYDETDTLPYFIQSGFTAEQAKNIYSNLSKKQREKVMQTLIYDLPALRTEFTNWRRQAPKLERALHLALKYSDLKEWQIKHLLSEQGAYALKNHHAIVVNTRVKIYAPERLYDDIVANYGNQFTNVSLTKLQHSALNISRKFDKKILANIIKFNAYAREIDFQESYAEALTAAQSYTHRDINVNFYDMMHFPYNENLHDNLLSLNFTDISKSRSVPAKFKSIESITNVIDNIRLEKSTKLKDSAIEALRPFIETTEVTELLNAKLSDKQIARIPFVVEYQLRLLEKVIVNIITTESSINSFENMSENFLEQLSKRFNQINERLFAKSLAFEPWYLSLLGSDLRQQLYLQGKENRIHYSANLSTQLEPLDDNIDDIHAILTSYFHPNKNNQNAPQRRLLSEENNFVEELKDEDYARIKDNQYHNLLTPFQPVGLLSINGQREIGTGVDSLSSNIVLAASAASLTLIAVLGLLVYKNNPIARFARFFNKPTSQVDAQVDIETKKIRNTL